MTLWFERVYHTEPPSEGDFERENKSIELSDVEYLRKHNYFKQMLEGVPSKTNPMMPEALEMADSITKKKEAKSKNKKTTSTKKAKV